MGRCGKLAQRSEAGRATRWAARKGLAGPDAAYRVWGEKVGRLCRCATSLCVFNAKREIFQNEDLNRFCTARRVALRRTGFYAGLVGLGGHRDRHEGRPLAFGRLSRRRPGA